MTTLHGFCLPSTPKPVTLNGGVQMPSWFDIRGLTPNSPEDEEGIKEASKDLQKLISKEVSSGIPAERVFIGGFSQGGSLALYTAFGTDTKIGGVLVLSSWMPLNKYFINPANQKYNTNVPILQCHGESDPMVPIVWGRATSGIIQQFNPQMRFKAYRGLAHSSSPEEMRDIKNFLEEKLKDS